MPKNFSNNYYYQKIWAPWPCEEDITDLEVIGKLPDCIIGGTFYINGANPHYPNLDDPNPLDGDGMIYAFKFRVDKTVDYKNRWVRTEKFKTEAVARKALFHGTNSSLTGGDGLRFPETFSNANIIWHAGKLLSLQDEFMAYEIDPDSLETKGLYHIDGKRISFCAHSKKDYRTGELVNIGYNLDEDLSKDAKPSLAYFVIDKYGKILTSVSIPVPYLSLIHDFGVTEDYVILPIFPEVFNMHSTTSSPLYSWKPELGTFFVVSNRRYPEKVQYFKTETHALSHVLNAYQEDSDIIVFEGYKYDRGFLKINQCGLAHWSDPNTPMQLSRWRLNLKNGTTEEINIGAYRGEYPKIDDRYSGRKHRYGYSAVTLNNSLSLDLCDGLVRYDNCTNEKQIFTMGSNYVFSETTFVPNSESASEGDGVLLTLVYNKYEHKSSLLILDANNVASQPIALIKMPHHIRYTFHGNWIKRTYPL
ncbi:carotenoid oxygenase family protein (plasmid) [Candidatus Megaera polyxenophila]|uniref:carotenoid oxygenase family protein n=1 Tax=Candidatus Megaera polyxenophila TaxID=988779 RepID=UPI00249DFFA7|nr:carotenoid oxygenase family protein [Candidatus Megaera polyxenophila]